MCISTGMPCGTVLAQKGHALCTHSTYVTFLLWFLHPLIRHSLVCAVDGGSSVKYNSSCYSNLFLSDGNQSSTAANIPGLICPTLYFQRPGNLSDLTTAYFYNYIAADPQLYSYQGCMCTQPLVAYYYYSDTSG